MLPQRVRSTLLVALVLMGAFWATSFWSMSPAPGAAEAAAPGARSPIGAASSAERAGAEHIVWNAGCWLLGLGLVVTFGRRREVSGGARAWGASPGRARLVQRHNVA